MSAWYRSRSMLLSIQYWGAEDMKKIIGWIKKLFKVEGSASGRLPPSVPPPMHAAPMRTEEAKRIAEAFRHARPSMRVVPPGPPRSSMNARIERAQQR